MMVVFMVKLMVSFCLFFLILLLLERLLESLAKGPVNEVKKAIEKTTPASKQEGEAKRNCGKDSEEYAKWIQKPKKGHNKSRYDDGNLKPGSII